MAWCPQIINKGGCKVTSVALVWNDIQHFLFYVDQDKHVSDSSKLILFPHISQEFLLLLRLGFSPFISGRRPLRSLQMVSKEVYHKGLLSQTIFEESGWQPGDAHRNRVSELIALIFPALHVTTATLDSFFQVT